MSQPQTWDPSGRILAERLCGILTDNLFRELSCPCSYLGFSVFRSFCWAPSSFDLLFLLPLLLFAKLPPCLRTEFLSLFGLRTELLIFLLDNLSLGLVTG